MIALVPFPLAAQWVSVGNVDSVTSHRGNEIALYAGRSTVYVNVLASDLIRIRLAPEGRFAPDISWAVVKDNWPQVNAEIVESPSAVTISTQDLTVTITKFPLRFSFADREGHTLNEDEPSKGMAWNGRPPAVGFTTGEGNAVRVWKRMPESERYYGFGEKAGRFERRGTHMTMWNSDLPGYKADWDPLYQSIPFFYGINNGRAYGIFLDNSYWTSFDMGKESPTEYSFGAQGGELNYYFFYGPAPKKILSRFTELVGRMPLPPRWSLGYQQSRWSYAPEARVREIAGGFRDRKIPCDVIYLDIDYMEGYRIFTWSRKNFPDPKRMIADLAQDGFKIAVIVDPGIKADTAYHAYRSGLAGDHFLKYPDGRIFIGKVWPGECAFPDFTSKAAREWWGGQFAGLVEAGVLGWWNDMNEPSVFDVPTKTIDLSVIHDDNGLKTTHAKNHNVYGMQMTRATYDGIRNLLPDKRPFVLTRASYAGGHRYSSAWTGDNIASWEHLEMALPMCLNLSISGQTFVGTDIGGFIGNPSGELFARWLQLGVFAPLMRAHSEINAPSKEPWVYGTEFTKINRETIELRYKLLPYIYNVMYKASATGMPAMRPLIFEYPEDGRYIYSDKEFMFGEHLLIAPVLWEGSTQRSVALPQGEWFDYWTGKKYTGGKTIMVDAPLHYIPILVRAGAIIPSQQVVQYSDQAPIDPLTLTVYPVPFMESSQSIASADYYEDDGVSFEYQKGVFMKRTMTQTVVQGSTTITASNPEGSYIPPRRSVIVEIVDVGSVPRSVQLNGKRLRRTHSSEFRKLLQGWTYSDSKKVLSVKVEDRMMEYTILVQK